MARRQEQGRNGSRRGSRFCIPPSTVHRLPSTSPAGFTLLEVLVAMGILMLIVAMMATLFHSSTIAWDNGLRQAEMSIQARAAMSLIQHDLAQAVCSGEFGQTLTCNLVNGADKFEVCTLGTTTGDVRTIKSVFYGKNGRILSRESQILLPTPEIDDYGTYGKVMGGDFLDEVVLFEISTPGGGSYTTNLPEWIEVKMTLDYPSVGAAGIKVWSKARDRESADPMVKDEDTDDIRTWRVR